MAATSWLAYSRTERVAADPHWLVGGVAHDLSHRDGGRPSSCWLVAPPRDCDCRTRRDGRDRRARPGSHHPLYGGVDLTLADLVCGGCIRSFGRNGRGGCIDAWRVRASLHEVGYVHACKSSYGRLHGSGCGGGRRCLGDSHRVHCDRNDGWRGGLTSVRCCVCRTDTQGTEYRQALRLSQDSGTARVSGSALFCTARRDPRFRLSRRFTVDVAPLPRARVGSSRPLWSLPGRATVGRGTR